MSDTTAYLAGCATTGVAALVLLVARVGMVSSGVEADRTGQLGGQSDRIETTAIPTSQPLDYEIRRELDKQRFLLTEKLEAQFTQQEALSASLEDQIKAQEEKTQDLLAQIQTYQRSVEDMKLQDKIAAAARPAAEPVRSGPSTPLIWLGAGVVVVLILGGGGLILCAILLIMQSQRRSARPVPLPPPMPMSPAYRYSDQAFLPPAPMRPQRPAYYDYPPSPYDYPR